MYGWRHYWQCSILPKLLVQSNWFRCLLQIDADLSCTFDTTNQCIGLPYHFSLNISSNFNPYFNSYFNSYFFSFF